MYCSNCKLEVIESQEELFIPCHCDAPVIAEMEATVIQSSNLE
jgi:hypothetical protein